MPPHQAPQEGKRRSHRNKNQPDYRQLHSGCAVQKGKVREVLQGDGSTTVLKAQGMNQRLKKTNKGSGNIVMSLDNRTKTDAEAKAAILANRAKAKAEAAKAEEEEAKAKARAEAEAAKIEAEAAKAEEEEAKAKANAQFADYGPWVEATAANREAARKAKEQDLADEAKRVADEDAAHSKRVADKDAAHTKCVADKDAAEEKHRTTKPDSSLNELHVYTADRAKKKRLSRVAKRLREGQPAASPDIEKLYDNYVKAKTTQLSLQEQKPNNTTTSKTMNELLNAIPEFNADLINKRVEIEASMREEGAKQDQVDQDGANEYLKHRNQLIDRHELQVGAAAGEGENVLTSSSSNGTSGSLPENVLAEADLETENFIANVFNSPPGTPAEDQSLHEANVPQNSMPSYNPAVLSPSSQHYDHLVEVDNIDQSKTLERLEGALADQPSHESDAKNPQTEQGAPAEQDLTEKQKELAENLRTKLETWAKCCPLLPGYGAMFFKSIYFRGMFDKIQEWILSNELELDESQLDKLLTYIILVKPQAFESTVVQLHTQKRKAQCYNDTKIDHNFLLTNDENGLRMKDLLKMIFEAIKTENDSLAKKCIDCINCACHDAFAPFTKAVEQICLNSTIADLVSKVSRQRPCSEKDSEIHKALQEIECSTNGKRGVLVTQCHNLTEVPDANLTITPTQEKTFNEPKVYSKLQKNENRFKVKPSKVVGGGLGLFVNSDEEIVDLPFMMNFVDEKKGYCPKGQFLFGHTCQSNGNKFEMSCDDTYVKDKCSKAVAANHCLDDANCDLQIWNVLLCSAELIAPNENICKIVNCEPEVAEIALQYMVVFSQVVVMVKKPNAEIVKGTEIYINYGSKMDAVFKFVNFVRAQIKIYTDSKQFDLVRKFCKELNNLNLWTEMSLEDEVLKQTQWDSMCNNLTKEVEIEMSEKEIKDNLKILQTACEQEKKCQEMFENIANNPYVKELCNSETYQQLPKECQTLFCKYVALIKQEPDENICNTLYTFISNLVRFFKSNALEFKQTFSFDYLQSFSGSGNLPVLQSVVDAFASQYYQKEASTDGGPKFTYKLRDDSDVQKLQSLVLELRQKANLDDGDTDDNFNNENQVQPQSKHKSNRQKIESDNEAENSKIPEDPEDIEDIIGFFGNSGRREMYRVLLSTDACMQLKLTGKNSNVFEKCKTFDELKKVVSDLKEEYKTKVQDRLIFRKTKTQDMDTFKSATYKLNEDEIQFVDENFQTLQVLEETLKTCSTSHQAHVAKPVHSRQCRTRPNSSNNESDSWAEVRNWLEHDGSFQELTTSEQTACKKVLFTILGLDNNKWKIAKKNMYKLLHKIFDKQNKTLKSLLSLEGVCSVTQKFYIKIGYSVTKDVTKDQKSLELSADAATHAIRVYKCLYETHERLKSKFEEQQATVCEAVSLPTANKTLSERIKSHSTPRASSNKTMAVGHEINHESLPFVMPPESTIEELADNEVFNKINKPFAVVRTECNLSLPQIIFKIAQELQSLYGCSEVVEVAHTICAMFYNGNNTWKNLLKTQEKTANKLCNLGKLVDQRNNLEMMTFHKLGKELVVTIHHLLRMPSSARVHKMHNTYNELSDGESSDSEPKNKKRDTKKTRCSRHKRVIQIDSSKKQCPGVEPLPGNDSSVQDDSNAHKGADEPNRFQHVGTKPTAEHDMNMQIKALQHQLAQLQEQQQKAAEPAEASVPCTVLDKVKLLLSLLRQHYQLIKEKCPNVVVGNFLAKFNNELEVQELVKNVIDVKCLLEYAICKNQRAVDDPRCKVYSLSTDPTGLDHTNSSSTWVYVAQFFFKHFKIEKELEPWVRKQNLLEFKPEQILETIEISDSDDDDDL